MSAEVAGMAGRYWKAEGQHHELGGQQQASQNAYEKAREAYGVLLDKDPRAYYLADNVGQMSLKVGDIEGAKKAYQKAEEALTDIMNSSHWSLATAATAVIVLEREDEAIKHLQSIRQMKPNANDLDRIRAGLRLVQQGLKLTDEQYQNWLRALGQS